MTMYSMIRTPDENYTGGSFSCMICFANSATHVVVECVAMSPYLVQTSEFSELLDPTRANCWISAQHQPGKFIKPLQMSCIALLPGFILHRPSMGNATSAYMELILHAYTCMCIPRPKAACCNTCQHTDLILYAIVVKVGTRVPQKFRDSH